ncbi:hypothetical protein F511_11481 [Dorcoceras hygrometricum]|uniref:Uncharacterized protein n=1 Tax=Dorcoceras hygrometricum TaxID=472368 RepID=A0A2Z7CYA7_9LAMI|nr:hypothetical protein F511_11481 [Dorcoceras hygrometricum]
MKKIKLEASCSSPLATVEEIQKRLLRPLDSQPLSSYNAMNQSFYENQKNRGAELKREVVNRRLEDYLDPKLLCAAREIIWSQKRKIGGESRLTRRTSVEFDEFDRKSGIYNELKKAKIEKNIGAADLKSDSNSMGDCEFRCGHFSQFERTALKRFMQ